MCNFVHLHNHSEYSQLDGLSTVKQIAQTAKALGMNSVALTDHGVMRGTLDFNKACKEAGIKPIFGQEAYLTVWGASMDQKTKLERETYHLLLLAKNQVGFANLSQISTIGQLEGFYHKPRIDHKVLQEHASGLICTTGCMAGEIPRLIQQDRLEEAETRFKWYLDIFKDNFLVEFQWHPGVPELLDINEVLATWADRYGVMTVATNDSHYATAKDAITHDVMLCIQTQSKVDDDDRMRMSDDSYYLKSAEEMVEVLGEEAVANTQVVADLCNVELHDSKKFYLPHFPVPTTDIDYLTKLCKDALQERYQPSPLWPLDAQETLKNVDVNARLDFELDVVRKMELATYFLVVWDILNFCQKAGIWYNVRGSAAGSVIAYLLGITDIEPISNRLYFERFLNPNRVTLPDIDMDFQDDRRHEVVDYTVDKYGAACVAQIITFGTMKAKAAINDVTRALGYDRSVGQTITALLDNPEMGLVESREKNEKIQELLKDPKSERIYDLAIALEGKIRSAGTHAAGVIIADEPLKNYVPLNRLPGEGLSEKITCITQYEMGWLEKLGLLKMDYLGLRSLTIMQKACALIKKRHGLDYDLKTIPVHDKNIYDSLGQGNTTFSFQLEGSGMTDLMSRMKPKTLGDISAAISLFRPGPMDSIPRYLASMQGREAVTYRHPKLEKFLKNTYGAIVYQEQIMEIAHHVAGYTLAEADFIRKVIGKKDIEGLKNQHEKFVDGCVNNGVDRQSAENIWSDIIPASRYSFNLAHAASYGKLSAQTTWLRVNYPLETLSAYATAEASSNADSDEKLKTVLDYCKKQKVDVLPPCVNFSGNDFRIEGEALRFGLVALKGLPINAVRSIENSQPFADMDDFLRRTSCNKKAIDCLIKSGALDCLEDRNKLIATGAERIHKQIKNIQTPGLLAMGLELQRGDVTQEDWVAGEREILGFNLTKDPLEERMSEFRTTTSIDNLNNHLEGERVVIAGIVDSVRAITDKKGRGMAFLSVKLGSDKVDVTVFAKQWEEYFLIVEKDVIISVAGKVNYRNGKLSIIADIISKESIPEEMYFAERVAAPAPIVKPSPLSSIGRAIFVVNWKGKDGADRLERLNDLAKIHDGLYDYMIILNGIPVKFNNRISSKGIRIITDYIG